MEGCCSSEAGGCVVKSIIEAQEAFYKDRKTMDQGNDITFLMNAILEEARELHDERPDYMTFEKYIEQETVDVLLFCFALLRKLGVDPEAAVLEKIARNHCKYPSRQFLNGTPVEESVAACKAEWQAIGGNQQFYEDDLESERKKNFDPWHLLGGGR